MQQTYSTLHERLYSLELELDLESPGIDESLGAPSDGVGSADSTYNGEPVAAQIAQLQAKVREILHSNDIFRHISVIFKEFRTELDSVSKKEEETPQDAISEEEKEEYLLARMAAFLPYIKNVAKVQRIEFPELSGAVVESLDTTQIASRSSRIKEFVQLYEILVLQTMVVLNRVTRFAEKESNFWASVDGRLSHLVHLAQLSYEPET